MTSRWKKTLIVVGASALVLTGCATDPSVDAGKPAAAEETDAAPLVAEESVPEAGTPEAAYLALVRQYEKRDKLFAEAKDVDLVAAGEEACKQLSEGADIRDVRVVENEEPDAVGIYSSSSAIAGAAQDFLCPVD